MLQKKADTAKEVLGNARSRMVVIILAIIVVVVLAIAYVKFKRGQLPPAGMGSAMTGVPEITSIPGLGNPTREYAKLQEQQNIELAEIAARKGTSAMPTVVRATYIDSGTSSDLSKQSGAASSQGCGIEELKRARNSGVSAFELRCRGCSLAALKAAGYVAGELRIAGFGANELKDAGFSVSELRDAGFNASELKSAGFNAQELVKAGFTVGELKNNGFSSADLQAAGLSDDTSLNTSSAGECSVEKLQVARSKGVTAESLKKLGCSVAVLRTVGYTASELKEAGFSASDLKNAGFSVADLRAAGYKASDLKQAGFNLRELKEAGFSAGDLKSAGFSAGELMNAGFNSNDLKNAGFSATELRAGGFSAADLATAGFSPDELKDAGYTDGDLVRAGVIVSLGSSGSVTVDTCSRDSLKKARKAEIQASVLKKRGCSALALKEAGYTDKELKGAGYNLAEIGIVKTVDTTVTSETKKDEAEKVVRDLKKAREAGKNAAQLKKQGYSIEELKAAGFSAAELYAAGFSSEDLQEAGFSDKDIEIAKLQVDGSNSGGLPAEFGRLTEEQINNMSNEETANLLRQQRAVMLTQANQLFSVWTQIPMQQYVQGSNDSKDKETQRDAEEQKESSKDKQTKVDLKNSDVYKAGSIIFAVLDTEVNSDEASPVMATVIQGPLKGSKAIGNFQLVDKKLSLQFKVLSVPKLDTSITVNAVAVDPSTSKPAFASSVDNHYWYRYGSTIGAAFLNGLGQAVQMSGSNMTQTAGNTPIVTKGATSTLDKVTMAIGTVGQTIGTEMGNRINTPPTVKIKAGTSIGLMLMADLIVPKKEQKMAD